MSSRHRHGSRRGQLTCALLLCAPSVLGQEPVRVPVDLRAPEELDEERTILRGAVLGRRIDILQMLLGEQCLLSGAELDVPDTDGFTLLHLAVRNADAHAAKILLDCGSSAGRRVEDDTGGTALHQAVVQADEALIRLVATAAAREGALEIHSHRGHTALHGAALMDGSGVMTRVMLELGALVETRNRLAGDQALHYAAREGNYAATMALLDGGADPTTVDFSGATSIDMARWHGHQGVLDLLLNRSSGSGRAAMADGSLACERRADQLPLVQPGDLTRTFEHAISTHHQYVPSVLSRDPWIVMLDGFLSDREADQFVSACSSFVHSQVNQAGEGGSATNARVRTSAQCAYVPRPGCGPGSGDSSCREDPLLRGVLERIAELTRAPLPNLSIINVLRYQHGESYLTHHDQTHFLEPPLAEGARVYTVLYLSTPEEGGATRFPDLNITVAAEKGRALIWPSVLDTDVDTVDLMTFHEALPVTRGVKYVANLWVHQYDYQTPNVLRRCGVDFFPPGSVDPIARACSSQPGRRPAGRCPDVG